MSGLSYKGVLMLLFLFPHFLFGQSNTSQFTPQPFVEGLQFTAVKIDDKTPDWARKMYGTNPNFFQIEKLYKIWREQHPDLKNGNTRNFKHYYNYLNRIDGLDIDGHVKVDNEERIYDEKKKWLRSRNKLLREQSSLVQARSSAITDWESLGPFMMYQNGAPANIQANIYSICQSASNSNIVYAVSEAGGTLFKSTDKGNNWNSTNDNIHFSGPREIEVDPTDSDIIYLGSSHDINKSIDGGISWSSVYYNWNNATSSIIINPSNSNEILAAGSERVLRSTDAGITWSEIWTGRCYDLRYKPGNPLIVYALMNNATSLQTDFYKSTDGGVSWTVITNGWPNETSLSNYGGRLTVSDGFPDYIYAFVGANWTAAPTPKDGIKIMKSTNGGDTWNTAVNYDNGTGVNSGQGYYDWDIEVSDNNPDIVLFGTQGRWLTTDGFTTTNWALTGSALGHADLQEALFNGNDLWVANDGGIIKFTDETFSNYEVKQQGINAVSYWSFDQGWNRDAQVGSHYHNGTSARQETYSSGEYLSYGGAEPQFSALKHPNPDKAWSKGYGSINGKNLPDNISDPIVSFNYNITPNSEYGSSTWRESEIEILPYAYNTHFTGEGRTLWRSDDFGLAWNEIETFGSTDTKVTKIEIPRGDPNIIYISTYDPSGYKIYKTNNLGESFTELNGPAGFSSDGAYISVDQNNPDILWLASRNGGSDNNKVYKTTDGGTTWSNLSTDVLDNHSIRAIQSISGTDGGLYVISSNAVFYKNNSLSDWQPLLINLPSNPALRDIKPFYKESKIRVAGDGRGVWGAELFDTPTTVIPQPTVNLVDQPCNRDTLYFDDFSVLNHTGASWSWTFTPAPTYIDDANKRNPKVVFGNPGTYSATMHLTVNGIVYNKSLQKDIVIGMGCDAVGLAGNSYDVSAYQEHATVSGINKTLDSFTYSLWVRPRAAQVSTATIVSKSDQNAGINFYGDTKQVAIHYPGTNTWAYQTGLYAPEDRWTHLALTSDASTGEIILYVNGEKYEYSNFSAVAVDFDIVQIGWQHNWWGSRWFNGEIDEFCLYEKALTQDEIRLQMHLTKSPLQDPLLLHYYQFNESSGGQTLDKVGILHAETRGGRKKSRGPIGAGTSSKVDISASGIYEFVEEKLRMEFGAGSLPNGEVSVTKINNLPDEYPAEGVPNTSYWVIHNFGSNATFSALNSLVFEELENASPSYGSTDFVLYNRASNQDSTTWEIDDISDSFNPNNYSVTFDSELNFDTSGQLSISNIGAKGWIGLVSTAWEDPANWTNNKLPNFSSHVMIPANTPFQPLVSSNVSIKSLTLMDGAKLEVATGVIFSVD